MTAGTLMASSLSAAITLVAGTTEGPHMYVGHGASVWNTVPAGSDANVYWDSDNDGVFGETALGENSGNATTTLGFTIDITDGSSYYFAVQGFESTGTRDTIEFDIHNTTDSNIDRISIVEGGSETFFDGNGDEWKVDYAFTFQGYGDVVNNISHNPGGEALDHKAVLTFTAVPEPSSAALLGLGGIALILRRRK